MEDEDDDFGDLYSYVEGEASSAMNASPRFSKTPCVNDELDKQDGDNDRECVDVDTDDEDDDLDIVLNSGADNVRPGEGFTVGRNITNLRSRQLKDEGDDSLRAEESMGGKSVDNSRSLYKYLTSQSIAYGSDVKGIGCLTADYFSREDNGYWQQMGSRSMGPQNAERFCLPRARSILDVNVDIFGLKPWRHPGADITDYFNFGFNEDSWKLYCNQVDEYRHKGPVSSGTPPTEPAQSTEVDTTKGQAIQVEESVYERQSSMDVRRQLDRDSDVIQITIVDPADTEASNRGDVSGDDVTDHLSFSSATSEDESIEGNYMEEDHEIHQVVTVDTFSNSNNSKQSNLVAESSETFDNDRGLTELTRSVKPNYHHSEDSLKSDDKRGPYENRYHSRRLGDNRKHGDRIHHERCNNPAYSNKTHKDFNLKTHQVVTHDPIRTSNTRKEPNLAAESFEAEEIPANHSKSFDDDAYDRRRAYYTNDRLLTELTRSMKPGYHHPESDDKRRHDENRYHSRKYGDCTSHERCNNHAYKDLNPKIHHENDDIISRGTVEKRKYGEPRYHARHDSVYFPMSDYVHSKLHVDPYEEAMLYSKSEVSSGERFYGYEDWDAERFGSEMDRSISRISEDDEYYDERRRYNEDNRMMAGDWYHYEKGLKTGEKLLLRNKGEYFSETGYYDGENYKPFTYNDQKSDDVEYTRWEFGRNRRRVCSSLSDLNNPPSSEESRVMVPKNSIYRRHESYRGQSLESFDMEDHIMDVDGRVHMRRKRCRWQSEIQQEDEIMFRHENAKYCGYRNSLPFGKASRHKRLASDHFKELIDDPYVVGSQLVDNGSGYVKELTDSQFANGSRYYRQKNEVFSGKTSGKSRQRLPLSSRNSNLVVGEVKSTEKLKKPKKMNLNTRLKDKMARTDESKAIDEGLEFEEGQIVTEEVKVGQGHVNGPRNENGKSGIDNTRILEAMAKMEKRRARFNGPFTITRKNSDSPLKPTVVDSAQDTASKKQERPARKRRWGGS